ncbi:MAG: DUF1934 domain-containing protein [Clostridia bacterium]
MLQECKVKIKSKISGESDCMEFLSSGKFDTENGVTTIEYEEADRTGMNCVSRVVVAGDIVTLNRIGDTSSTMVFEKGKSFSGAIITAYGALPLSIYSHKVDFKVEKHKMLLELLYTIDVNDESSLNELSLTADM